MEQSEPPIQIESLIRLKNKEWLKGKKADMVICSTENPGWCEQVTCKECGITCYHTPTSFDLKKKNVKMICVKCALTKFRKELNKEQIELLEMAKE